MAWSKMYILSFFGHLFKQTFLLHNWILQNFQTLKVEYKSFPITYHLSYVDINTRFREGFSSTTLFIFICGISSKGNIS